MFYVFSILLKSTGHMTQFLKYLVLDVKYRNLKKKKIKKCLETE